MTLNKLIFKAYSLISFDIFVPLWSYITTIKILIISIISKSFLRPPSHSSYLPLLQATTDPLSVIIDQLHFLEFYRNAILNYALVWLLSFSILILRLIRIAVCICWLFLLFLSGITLYEYANFFLIRHLLMNIWVISIVWLWQNCYGYLCTSLVWVYILFSPGYSGMESYSSCMFVNFLRNWKHFQSSFTILHSTNSV